MTSYGLPLRFKAVDTETGESSFPVDLSIEQTCINAAFTISTFIAEFDSLVNLPYGSKPSLYQSTGHNDARGQEVFFGDIVWDSEVMFEICLDEGRLFACVRDYRPGKGEYFFLDGKDSYLKQCVTIGNRHTPQSELEARAKAVAEDE